MKLKKQFRSMSVEPTSIDQETRTAEFSFSSELPVERHWGREILDHAPGSADLTRVNDSAPLLWNHNPDQVIGVVEAAEIRGDRRGYAKVRFARNAFAQEKFQDVQDGILRNISFGYQIDQMEEEKAGTKSEPPTFIAKRWMPFEISVVSIPADQTVGIGRAEVNEEKEVEVTKKQMGEGARVMEENKMDVKKVEEMKREGAEMERSRIASIQSWGKKFNQAELADQLIKNGRSIDEAREAFLEKVGSTQKPVVENAEMVDLTEKEKRAYSVVKALRAQMTGDWKQAGFERELSNEISKRMGKESEGFFMPLNVKMDGTRAAYAVGGATTGGNLVATNFLADSFIELLRNKMLMMNLGAKVLTGLQGNVAIPKQTGTATAYWVSEAAAVTESEGLFGQVSMNPKTVGARSQFSRQLLLQGTPDIEMLVRSDLATVIALALDQAAISGSGTSGQPTGILNQSGIGSVAMGTNGAAFTNIDPLIDLETAVATANADFGSLAYVTNAVQVGKLKKLKATTNEYLWNGYEAAVNGGVPGEINGYKVGRSNQVPSTLTKGTASGICSAMIFGNFNDLIIGQWGPGVEILANPYGAGFNSGSIDVRALSSVDIAVRNAVSFAAITDLL